MLKLSIIIPAYKTAQYLPQCLDSVLFQDIQDLEAICINDGSPDNALEIMRSYAARDSRMVVIDKANEGVGAARNDGLKVARGEFVAFMDSDDFYPNPHVLSHLYDAATQNHLDCAGGHYVGLKPDGKTVETRFSFQGLDLNVQGVTEYQDFQFDFGYTCYIYKNIVLRENHIVFPHYSRFQDPPFFVQVMHACKRFYALNEPTYCYRVNYTSEKYTFKKTIDEIHGVIDNIVFSRKNNYPVLHYISAIRLKNEVSYMAINNIQNQDVNEIVCLLCKASSLIDINWLREKNVFFLSSPFCLDFFDYLINTTKKYEKLRNSFVLRIFRFFIKAFSNVATSKKNNI